MDQLHRLAVILEQLEDTTDPIAENDVTGSLRALLGQLSETGDEPRLEIHAEMMAFSLVEGGGSTLGAYYYGPSFVFTDGSVFPDIEQVTPEMIGYWSMRAEESSHPCLRGRYADLVWDLSNVATGRDACVDMACTLVDSTVELVEKRLFKYEARLFKKLERALSVALRINDKKRVIAVRDQIVSYEDCVSRDELAGTWGYAMDLLLLNKKVPVDEVQEEEIVKTMAERLQRICSRAEGPSDIHAGQLAAFRLEKYYLRKQQPNDATGVIRSYGELVGRACDSLEPMISHHWMEKLFEIYSARGMKKEAAEVSPVLHSLGESAARNMERIATQYEISAEELEGFAASFCDADFDSALTRVAQYFVPNPAQIEKEVRDLAARFPLQAIIPQSLKDPEGRTVATIGSVEDDLDGNVVHQTAQNLHFEVPFLRRVLERILVTYDPSVDELMSYLAASPVIGLAQEPVLRVGLNAYLNGDNVTAVAILTPQVEALVRALVRLQEGRLYRTRRGSHGGLMLRMLEDLLRDEATKRALGEAVVSYLCVLLTDQRGWNVRNVVCHGLLAAKWYGPAIADRLVHAVLLFGQLRHQAQDSPDLEGAV